MARRGRAQKPAVQAILAFEALFNVIIVVGSQRAAPHLAGPSLVVGVQQFVAHIGAYTVGQSVTRGIGPVLIEIGMEARVVGNSDWLRNHISQERKLLGAN